MSKSQKHLLSIVLFIFALFPSGLAFAQIQVANATGCAPHITSFSALGTYTNYAWSFSNGATSTASQPTMIFAAPGVYGVSLTASSGNGNSQSFTLSAAVTVSLSPSPDFSLEKDTICLGDTLFAEVGNPSSGSTYQWSFGDGNSTSAAQTFHVYTQSGSYAVNVVESNNGGCSAYATARQVYVSALPDASISASSNVVCTAGETLVFSNQSSASTFQWSLNGSPVSTASTASLTFSTPGSQDILLQVSNAAGCSATSAMELWVATPQQHITTASALEGCAPLNLSMTHQTDASGTVQWQSPAGQHTGDSVAISISESGFYSVSLAFTDSLGCVFHDTIDSIHVKPVPPISFTISDTVLCDQDLISLMYTGGSATMVQWTLAGVTSTGNSVDFLLDETGSYDLSIAATMTNGCIANHVEEEVVKLESAMPEFLQLPVSDCAPFDFSVFHNNPDVVDALWLCDEDSLVGESVTFSIDSFGVYDLTYIGTSAHGCTDTVHYPALISMIQASVEWEQPSLVNACNSAMVTFDGKVLGDTNFVWDFGDGTVSNDDMVSHFYENAGTYVVSMQAENMHGCTFNIDSHTVVNVGVPEVDFDFELVSCNTAEVLFYSLVSADSWYWEVGNDTFTDSSFTVALNPTIPISVRHSIETAGGCTAELLSLNAIMLDSCLPTYGGNVNTTQTVDPSLWYQGIEEPYRACAPASISFSHPEDSLVNVIFDFGDGDTVHTASGNAVHTYDSAGVFDVVITTVHLNGDTQVHAIPGYIMVGKPQAGFVPEISNMCAGGSAIFQNTSTATQYWNTYFGDGTSSGEEHPVHSYDTSGYFTIEMIGSDSLLCASSAHQLVAVGNPMPDIAFSTTMCAGASQELTNNIDGFVSYQWLVGDSIFEGKEPVIVMQEAGDYPMKLQCIDTSACTLEFFDGLVLSVFKPSVDFEVNTGDVACDALNEVLVAESGSAALLRWYVDGDFVSTDTTLEVNVHSEGMHFIQLTATEFGCQASYEDSVLVRKGLANFGVNYNSLCLPQVVSITDSSDMVASWNWEFFGGQTSQIQNPTITVEAAHTDSIHLTVIDSFGCVSSTAKPAIPFHALDIEVSNDELCFNQTLVIRDKVGNGINYLWHIGDTSIVGSDSLSLVMDDTGYISIGIEVAYLSGCTSTVQIDSAVYVHRPQADFEVASLTEGCAPQLASFVNTSAEDYVQYLWKFGDGGSSQLENPSYAYDEPGDYQVSLRVSDAFGCKDEKVIENAVRIDGPKAAFSLSSERCEDEPLAFVNASTNASQFMWLFGDGFSSSEEDAEHMYAEPGEYEVTLMAVDTGGCFDLENFGPLAIQSKPELRFEIEQLSNCLPARFVLRDSSSHLENPDHYVYFGSEQVKVTPHEAFEYALAGNHMLRVEIDNNNGCTSDSTAPALYTIYDTIAGTEAKLTDISVVNQQHQLAFQLDVSDNYSGARVLRLEGAEAIEIWSGTDDAINVVDVQGYNSSKATCYSVELGHHCATSAPVTSLDRYCTIHLDIENLGDKRHFTWNSIGDVSLKSYALMAQHNEKAGFRTLADLSAEVHAYTDSTELCPGNIEYMIMAIEMNGEGDVSSQSLTARIDTLDFLKEVIDIDYVTVLDNDRVLVEWDASLFNSPLVQWFELSRTGSDGVAVLYEVDARATQFIDEQVATDATSYTYQLKAIDRCGVNPHFGASFNSVLLTKDQDGNVVKFDWNGIEALEGKLRHYELQVRDEYGQWKTIERIDPEKRSITIDLRDLETEP